MVMGSESTPDPVTLVYKTISIPSSETDGKSSELPLHVDVYLPNFRLNNTPTSEGDDVGVPAVVYFHGGGLVVGSRKSWFPEWLRSEHCF
jgi:acetyl esterase/lipase